MNAVVLAELNIRHTRLRMPTRRVAIDPSYLPTSIGSAGPDLITAVSTEFIRRIDKTKYKEIENLITSISDESLEIPSIHLQHRLQLDTHGLDRSRHRVIDDGAGIIVEIDVHALPETQVLGILIAISQISRPDRDPYLKALRKAMKRRGAQTRGLRIRLLEQGVAGERPGRASPAEAVAGSGAGDRFGLSDHDQERWVGVDAELRWAMEVLGMSPDSKIDRKEIQRRYRRLLRTAHPDHGGDLEGAADRIARLGDARSLLLSNI